MSRIPPTTTPLRLRLDSLADRRILVPRRPLYGATGRCHAAGRVVPRQRTTGRRPAFLPFDDDNVWPR